MNIKTLLTLLLVWVSFSSIVSAKPMEFDDFFRGLEYSNLRLSPDGKHFLAGKAEANGELHAFIFERRTGKLVSDMKFAGKVGIQSVSWVNNERVLINVGYDSPISEGFGSTGRVAAMNIDGTRKDMIWQGKTSQYGGIEGGSLLRKLDAEHYLLMINPSGSGMSKFPYFYFYKLNVYTKKTEFLYRSPIRMGKPIVKPGKDGKEGEITHWVGRLPDSFHHTVIHEKQSDGSWQEVIYDQSKGERVPLAYSADGKFLFYHDTLDAPTTGLMKKNLETGEMSLVYRHPKVDYSKTYKDENGDIWGVLVNYDYPKTIYLDEDNYYAEVQKKMEATFPNQVIQIASKTADNNEWLIHVSSDVHPGKYYIFNQFDGSIKFLVNRAEWIDPNYTAPLHAVRFNARDGLEINAYLTLPKGKSQNLPLIILTHGGPHGIRDYWTYLPEHQLLASRGYAVLSVNYRGSGGFGREFLYDWYGHWGLEMQDDLTDATHWAIQNGIADKDRICMYGASYGGYASLMGVVREPDLYKCTIGYVGVYDLNVMMTTGDVALRESGINYLTWALGDTEEKRRAQSPAPNADKIKSAVFLMHGERDFRAHFKNFEVMRDALIEQNHRFETLTIPRAGHGARKAESRWQIWCRMFDFLERNIGEGDPLDAPSTECVPEGDPALPFELYEGKLGE